MSVKNQNQELYIESGKGNVEAVQALLATDPSAATTDNGFTSVCIAAYNGHVEVVQALLNTNANPNDAMTVNGATPVYIAVQEGHVKVVKALLAANANPSTNKNPKIKYI
jgi:ankyrin repeat protein